MAKYKKNRMDYMEGSLNFLDDTTKPTKKTFVTQEVKSVEQTAKGKRRKAKKIRRKRASA